MTNNQLFSPENMKVLIVDDTPVNIDILRKTLAKQGYQIFIAPNGKICLKIATNVLPDLILLDVLMPGMDGFETCRQLKSHATTKDIPVIFITAKTEVDDVVKGFHVGGVDYITKPFRTEEVSVRVKTQLQLVASMQQLKMLSEQKNKFLGIAAHDLRAPISGICGFAEYIRDDFEQLDADEVKESADFIIRAGEMMLSLVNNLLDVAMIESGKMGLNLRKHSLSLLIKERVGLSHFSAKKKNISIKTTFKDDPEWLLDGDRISQVLDNLITNAIKFSPRDANIHIVLLQQQDRVRVSVQDEGPGLSEEDKTKVFASFQKLSAKPTSGEKSSGLGLAIVKKIIDAHQGVIEVDSESNHGATFSFSLPELTH